MNPDVSAPEKAGEDDEIGEFSFFSANTTTENITDVGTADGNSSSAGEEIDETNRAGGGTEPPVRHDGPRFRGGPKNVLSPGAGSHNGSGSDGGMEEDSFQSFDADGERGACLKWVFFVCVRARVLCFPLVFEQRRREVDGWRGGWWAEGKVILTPPVG